MMGLGGNSLQQLSLVQNAFQECSPALDTRKELEMARKARVLAEKTRPKDI